MGSHNGHIIGTSIVLENGPREDLFNLVILSEGYKDDQIETFERDVLNFMDKLFLTPPFSIHDWVRQSMNVFSINVASTDSGAKDPVACEGTGADPKTYFDATFCTGGVIRRALTVNNALVTQVAAAELPEWDNALVIVNSSIWGGTASGNIGVNSRANGWENIAIHELGHSVFGLADEYQYLAGCTSGETGHDTYTGGEPAQPNVTKNSDRATIKWDVFVQAATPMPTQPNPNCAACNLAPNPEPADTVGAYEGAKYFHCGLYRPQYNCKMRSSGEEFCAICQHRILETFWDFRPESIGASGGYGGTAFVDKQIPQGARITKIRVRHGSWIDAIGLSYEKNGITTDLPMHGGQSGTLSEFVLAPDEFIQSITGRYGAYVDMIIIHTNKRSSIPFGGSGGPANFSYSVTEKLDFAGFSGRSAVYLDALGWVLREKASGTNGVQESIGMGPMGGHGGFVFRDPLIEASDQITKVRIRHGSYIDAVGLTSNAGELPLHGGGDGTLSVFDLEPGEYITGVYGRYGVYIDSLTIVTSNGRHSPLYGGTGGVASYLIALEPDLEVVGFLGRSGAYIDAVGCVFRQR